MKKWRLLGSVLQALVLGVLLFLALARLIMVSFGTGTVFKYQGF